MRAGFAMAGAVVLAVLPVDGLRAVELVNEDRNPYEVLVQDDHGQRFVEVAGGQRLRSLCSACAVGIETDDPIEVRGAEVVLIKDGKLQVTGQTARR